MDSVLDIFNREDVGRKTAHLLGISLGHCVGHPQEALVHCLIGIVLDIEEAIVVVLVDRLARNDIVRNRIGCFEFFDKGIDELHLFKLQRFKGAIPAHTGQRFFAVGRAGLVVGKVRGLLVTVERRNDETLDGWNIPPLLLGDVLILQEIEEIGRRAGCLKHIQVVVA